jgi:aminopeptidase N
MALYADLPEAITEAKKRFLAGPIDSLDPELRVTLMANAVRRQFAPDVVDTLITAYPKITNSEFRDDVAAALTAAKDMPTIARLISLLKNTEFIRMQDFVHWFVWLLRNRYGRETAWQWTRDNWDWIAKTFKDDASYDILPRYVAGSLVTRQQMEEYKAFFTPFESEIALKRNIQIGYTELEGTITLLETDGPVVRQALLDLK